MYSLESPLWGDSNEYKQHTFKIQITEKRYLTIISIVPPGVALLVTFQGSSYRCLEQIFMVPKGFEPSKFDCRWLPGAVATELQERRDFQEFIPMSYKLEAASRYDCNIIDCVVKAELNSVIL